MLEQLSMEQEVGTITHNSTDTDFYSEANEGAGSVNSYEQETLLYSNHTDKSKTRLSNNTEDINLVESSEELPTGRHGKPLDDVLSEIKFGLFHKKMMLLTCGAYLAVCSEMMMVVFLVEPVQKEWNISNMTYAALFVISSSGGMMGGVVFGILSDKIGRRIPFIVCALLLALFGVLIPFSNSFYALVTFKTLSSVAIGGLEALVFVLLLEFLPRKNRGSCLVSITFCGTLGAIYAGGMGWWLLPRYGWRVFVGACAVPACVMVPLTLWLVRESPRFLFISGREEAAKKTLNDMAILNHLKVYEGDIWCDKSKARGRIQDLFSVTFIGRTVVISLIWILQCLGFWGVTIFLPKYMNSLGLDPYFSMFSVFLAELPGMCLAMILIEPHMLGRIKCLRFFSLFTSLSLVLFAFVDVPVVKAVCVVVCFYFMVPLYSILNTFTPELYPTEVRATALSFVNILIEIPSVITPFISASLLSSPSLWMYPIVWAVGFFLQSCLTFFLYVETAGKDLFDIRKRTPPPQTEGKVTKIPKCTKNIH